MAPVVTVGHVTVEGPDISAETGGVAWLILGLPGDSAAGVSGTVSSLSASMCWLLCDAGVDGFTIGVLA